MTFLADCKPSNKPCKVRRPVKFVTDASCDWPVMMSQIVYNLWIDAVLESVLQL